jgi:2-succinyl-6-hydroxy-2,4-cyclohexadiene-1-carboxylate synthase
MAAVGDPETLVLLHGFGGTRRAWDGVVAHLDPQTYRPLALDLPGHGDAPRSSPVTFDACAGAILARAPRRFALCGYSMGGRIALQVALAAPERVSMLVLVSSTAGIESPVERAERRRADDELAVRLERAPYEDFIEAWRGQALFAGDPPEVSRLAREDQRRNDPHALAAAMRGLSTGRMLPLWDRLSELRMPLLIIAGASDQKFSALAHLMHRRAPVSELCVLPGGHVLPLESSQGVAAALQAHSPASWKQGQALGDRTAEP